MEAGEQAPGVEKWLYWLLWWKADPDELRRQVEGYTTLTMLRSARGRGLLLAALCGVGNAAVGVWVASVAVMGGWPQIGVGEGNVLTVCVVLAEGMAFFLLGCLLYRGSPWAALGLMGLSSFDRVFEAAVSNGHFYPLPGRHIGVWVLISLLAWCLCMHVFYAAFRVERSREGMA
jgi:hypothetical protein